MANQTSQFTRAISRVIYFTEQARLYSIWNNESPSDHLKEKTAKYISLAKTEVGKFKKQFPDETTALEEAIQSAKDFD